MQIFAPHDRSIGMNCYDCGNRGRLEAAVAMCVNCGAGMCSAHTQVEELSLDQQGLGNPAHVGSTRRLFCVSCDQVFSGHPAATAVG